MANLLEKRDGGRVGKLWTARFIARRQELKTRLNRVYDFQRAACEDPELINAWFKLVDNMKTKYGIADNDFYNFNKTVDFPDTTQPNRLNLAIRIGEVSNLQSSK